MNENSLEQAALKAHRAEEEARKEAEARQAKVQAERRRKIDEAALKSARGWAIPILSRTFGVREDWKLANPQANTVEVYVNETKTLTVHRDPPRVTGRFRTRAVLRFDRYGDVGSLHDMTIGSLTELGAMLAREQEVIDREMCNAD